MSDGLPFRHETTTLLRKLVLHLITNAKFNRILPVDLDPIEKQTINFCLIHQTDNQQACTLLGYYWLGKVMNFVPKNKLLNSKLTMHRLQHRKIGMHHGPHYSIQQGKAMATTLSSTSGKWTVKSPRGIHIFLVLIFFFLERQEGLQKIKHIQLNSLCNYMNIINSDCSNGYGMLRNYVPERRRLLVAM